MWKEFRLEHVEKGTCLESEQEALQTNKAWDASNKVTYLVHWISGITRHALGAPLCQVIAISEGL